MKSRFARLAVLLVLGTLVQSVNTHAGQQHAQAPARSPASSGHHHAPHPRSHTSPTSPTMGGLSGPQVLSGPLPMFPAPPASPFTAAPSTYVPHAETSPFPRPRRSIVMDGFAFGADAPPEAMPPTAASSDVELIEMPAAAPPGAQPPTALAPDLQTPVAPPRVVVVNRAPVTLYVIPGCYAGDRPPADGILPAGCDVTKMRTLRY